MKICFLADGQSIHTQRLCSHFVKRGYDVHLITFKDCLISGVSVHYLNAGSIDSKGGNWKVLLKLFKVKAILNTIKPDVLHAQYATSYGLVGALTFFKPFIITTLGTDILLSPKQSFLYRIIVKFVMYRANWVTTMGEHMKREIVSMGVPIEKVESVLYGIDGNIFNMNGKVLESTNFVITSTRNFEPVYSIDTIVDAILLIRDKVPNLKVNFVGDGSLRQDMVDKVNKYGLEKQCVFLGKIPQPKIAELLRASNVFISMSLSDGNNISLNEAMACGVYSIVSDIQANRYWIKEGLNGNLIPVKNAQLLADKILYFYDSYSKFSTETMFEYNSNILNEFALWDNNMLKIENKYLELCKA